MVHPVYIVSISRHPRLSTTTFLLASTRSGSSQPATTNSPITQVETPSCKIIGHSSQAHEDHTLPSSHQNHTHPYKTHCRSPPYSRPQFFVSMYLEWLSTSGHTFSTTHLCFGFHYNALSLRWPPPVLFFHFLIFLLQQQNSTGRITYLSPL